MSDLSRWDDQWSDAPVQLNTPVPDGVYQARITTARMETSKKGNDMLAWQLTILAGEHKGRLLFNYNVIASADNLKWLKTNLAICGVELERVSDLPRRLEDLIGVVLEVRVKGATASKGGDVWFNKTIDVAPNPGDDVQDDDVPF
jgi:hypothetical protein